MRRSVCLSAPHFWWESIFRRLRWCVHSVFNCKICGFQVSFWSNIRPRNLKVGTKGIIWLKRRTSGSASERVLWKNIAFVLGADIWNPRDRVHSHMLSIARWSSLCCCLDVLIGAVNHNIVNIEWRFNSWGVSEWLLDAVHGNNKKTDEVDVWDL